MRVIRNVEVVFESTCRALFIQWFAHNPRASGDRRPTFNLDVGGVPTPPLGARDSPRRGAV